ncbi:class I SAM-dependent methyltransferase [Streptomyces sp. NBC_00162]|uniref:class I SAM-dependent methyltransferase n=1 Tax=Streptomyces sp. NBC_00162 TaxID=2903629 RepID=UPI00214C4091|nr:class I SAM-dependent methyltransferase [Streptomyces sp. NBC_00162]UUU43564.1 class I SAM-dependent methyltransferase [Streptomyces sp. NBC_00162]
MTTADDYETYVAEAQQATMKGWDFSWLNGRADGGGPSWDYEQRARVLLSRARSLLDIDTGGGEFLAALTLLPPRSVATEYWVPNLRLARQRLSPLGVEVHQASGSNLPPGPFDLVLNRHGVLDAAGIRTALAPGGRLLTQQVGSRNQLELNEPLGIPAPADPDSWTLDVAVRALEGAGLRVATAREEMSPYTFHDIGAVIFQLRAIPWQFPGFEPSEHESALRRLDRRIRIAGGFTVRDHRFLIEAQAGRWSAVEPGRAAVDVPPGRCPH